MEHDDPTLDAGGTPDEPAALVDAPASEDAPAGEDPPSEDAPGEEEGGDSAAPAGFDRWRRRSATGAVMTGIAMGLREVFQTQQDQPAVVIEASGQPEDEDAPYRLHFDPDHPERTTVVFRPATPGPTPPHPPERDGG